MFCPQCGSAQTDEVKFCKACGANLYAVRQAVATREADEKFDWGKTWVAEMFISEAERKRRQAELERQSGITPEVKRYNEIKAGVITSCVGIGVSIFLYFLAQGIVLSGQNPPGEAEIISRIWIAGVIPFMVGIGLLINGLFVSRKLVELSQQDLQPGQDALGKGAEGRALRPPNTTEFVPSDLSVTEGTTRHLNSSGPKQ